MACLIKTCKSSASFKKIKENLSFHNDGVEEVMEEKQLEQQESEPDSVVDPKTLTWGPWLSHYTWKSGKKMLNAVDYAGESLAGFFGITTPKYQLEIDEYERLKEEKRKIEEESAGWIPKNAGGDIPLVLTEPTSTDNGDPQGFDHALDKTNA